MKKQLIGALFTGLISLSIMSTADATLVSRLGGLAVYDTDLDITWLADANAGAGSAFDSGFSATDGLMNVGASEWTASLNVAGVTGWRLPTTLSSDVIDPCYEFSCTGSEMGHLFYNELGGTVGQSILTSTDPDLALFSNIQSGNYWSATTHDPYTDLLWIFDFNDGFQLTGDGATELFYAWAVHSGDVSAVPIPTTVWLFGSGLISLLGLKHRTH